MQTSSRELAHRSGDGLEVTLLWCPSNRQSNSVVVCVYDSRSGAYFEITPEPYLALHAYRHPFAYRDFSAPGWGPRVLTSGA